MTWVYVGIGWAVVIAVMLGANHAAQRKGRPNKQRGGRG